MAVASPPEGFKRAIKYGHHKVDMCLSRLIVQAFMAGLWVAVYGHCCTSIAALFYDPEHPTAPDRLSKIVYGCLFPGAFVAVALTGTELFTGNTAIMSMFVLNNLRTKDCLKTGIAALRVLAISLTGNYVGAAFGAVFLSYASKVFHNSRQAELLFAMAQHKIKGPFFSLVAQGVGCNMLVCLATWTTLIIDDGAGKILGMWFTVAVFAMGGFEHIIANFYTLTLAFLEDSSHFSIATVLVKNWIPVCIGNCIAGFLCTGCIWWYTLSPLPEHHYSFLKEESVLTSSKESQPLILTPV